jgi:Flp pilus assembly protein TadG
MVPWTEYSIIKARFWAVRTRPSRDQATLHAAAPRRRALLGRRLLRGRRAVASLEFILVAMPLMMAMLGFISLSAVFFSMSAMQISAQFAARLVSTGQVRNISSGPITATNESATTTCGGTMDSSEAEYYACAGLPTWASFSVTTREDCTIPSVSVTISTNGSAAAIADLMHIFTGKTISTTAVVMKEGLCP